MNAAIKKEITEMKQDILTQAELTLRALNDHFTYHQNDIFEALLEKPDRYVSEYGKLLSVVLAAFRNDEKVAVNINNTSNNYAAFFEETRKLSRLIDSGSHKLTKNHQGTYEMVKS